MTTHRHQRVLAISLQARTPRRSVQAQRCLSSMTARLDRQFSIEAFCGPVSSPISNADSLKPSDRCGPVCAFELEFHPSPAMATRAPSAAPQAVG
jgi:hypothetical protein